MHKKTSKIVFTLNVFVSSDDIGKQNKVTTNFAGMYEIPP